MKFAPFPLSRAGRSTVMKLLLAASIITLLTLVVDVAIVIRMNPDSPTKGDGPYYIGLARSLASGRGYYLENSFWPDLPNVARSPLWPAILAVPAMVFPNANDNAILRFTDAVLHAASAGLMLLLTFQLTGSFVGGALAGAFLGLYPPASGLVAGGYSEIPYLCVMLGGLILAFEGGKLAYAGLLVCGAAVLARSNYVVLPAVLLVLTAFIRPKTLLEWRNLRLWAIGSALFCLPAALWIVRNYAVSGYFPVLSAMEGETLYGGNNDRVASDLSVWGYWIMPNEIPGEQTKRDLALTRTELEVNKYYHDRGMQFIRANWYALPRLIVGKLVRGFVPVPWVPLAASYGAFFFRACVYLAFAAFWFRWRDRNQAYTFLAGAMFLVTLATTVIYYGTFRFTFCVEPFLFPFIVGGVLETVRARRRSTEPGTFEPASF
jgi:4-amino-4-deoxy-L-arabinose transferase-like glycosyltransferase